jgi:histidinol-phosphate/aromatic aminotransferase/cobyric acid decarboxylase-like protein
MSKAFGLAGLRVGWAVTTPRLATEIEKSRGPYRVAGLAELAAVVQLGDGREWVRQTVRETVELRSAFTRELRERGFAPLESEANFVLLPVAEDADALVTRLRSRGVAARPFPALPGIGEAIRITVGPRDMLRAFLEALDGVGGTGARS